MNHAKHFLLFGCAAVFSFFVLFQGNAQTSGTISGKVVDQKTGDALGLVNILVKGTNTGASTAANGKYEIANVPAGRYTLVARIIGYEVKEIAGVNVRAGATVTVNFSLAESAVMLGEQTVYGASRRAERIVEAPAAISALTPVDLQLTSSHGQLPRLLETEPGVDIVQSGVYDFNINTRGFNSSLNRRLLVLLDGRDMAAAFLGSQEWNSFPMPLEDIGKLELVRGPGSALYGPNAYNGVISITTPAPTEILGTKLSVSGGELQLFRGDFRHAAKLTDNWSFKMNVGHVQSGSWSKSRLKAPFEYAGLGPELRMVDDGAVTSTYGSARVDYDFGEQQKITIEGGLGEVQNEILVTGIGRIQVSKAQKPWGRLNYSTDHWNILFWGHERKSIVPQYSLASGAALDEQSQVYNGEVQYNFSALDDQIRIIMGLSHRLVNVDTRGTLMADKHKDNMSGVSAQVEFVPTDWIKFVAASRWDRSTLHKSEFSPKAGVVWSPDPNHGFRATYNQAFQVPNYSEFFLTAAAGRADVPFFASAANPKGTIPILARGNDKLIVEKITGYEIGYKGVFFDQQLFVTLDAYFNQAKDFVTDLLQGVNPAFPFNVPPGFPAGLIEVARSQIPGLAIVNGAPAIVVSYSNAGKVDERGVEFGVNFYLTDELFFSGNWTWYDFKVKDQKVGDILLPNAPKHKFSLSSTYRSKSGYEMGISARNVQPHSWAAGVFAGQIPAYTLVNLSAGYQINQTYRVGINVSNLLDHQAYQLFGGSIIGRHGIASITATF